jgi:hypothetical protein
VLPLSTCRHGLAQSALPNDDIIMSKKDATTASKQTNPATRLDAFAVREYENAGETKAEWLKIGTAFPHADGKGFNVVLHAVPVDGKLVLRTYEPKQGGAE